MRTFGRGYVAYAIEVAQSHACRVCGGAIERGAVALYRAWGVQYAHAACGWLRAEEREPHRLTGADAPRAWEWACTSCGRDVVRTEITVDRRCHGCRAEV